MLLFSMKILNDKVKMGSAMEIVSTAGATRKSRKRVHALTVTCFLAGRMAPLGADNATAFVVVNFFSNISHK